jgi:tetratricopeptide (TPR) repeat protein
MVYDSLGEHHKAGRLYRRALKLNPDSPVFLMDLGTNLMVQDKYKQGGEYFKRAFSLDHEILDTVEIPIAKNRMSPQHSGAIHYYQARGFAQAGMTEQAIQSLRRAIDAGFVSPG